MSEITPAWQFIGKTETRLGTVMIYRDPGLRARKEVVTTRRPARWTVTREYYTLDGRRRVYRREDELVKAILSRRKTP